MINSMIVGCGQRVVWVAPHAARATSGDASMTGMVPNRASDVPTIARLSMKIRQ
jgi:hypothetical protein